MKTKKLIPFLVIFAFIFVGLVFFCVANESNNQPLIASADSLTDEVDKQLGELDLEKLENFYNSLQFENGDFSPSVYIKKILSGEYSVDANAIFSGVISSIIGDISYFAPSFLTILAISILCSLVKSVRSTYLSENISDIISFVGVLSVILIFSGEIISFYTLTTNTVKNISKFSQVISPILLTLMVSSGGTVSASMYKPVTAMFSGGIISIVNSVILPIALFIMVFSLISSFSKSVKLNRFIELGSSIIKWVIGITVAIFGIFITIQGFGSAVHDGISVKATKYALSNSIPLIGGLFRDGFDIICCGSILIKNAVGIGGIAILCMIILSPVIKIAVYSLMLKLIAALTETFSENGISNLCNGASKSLSYFTVSILLSGFMLFITILLIIFTASVFI